MSTHGLGSSGGTVEVTTRLTDAECVAEGAVPVTVMGYVPAGTEAPTVSVSVDAPPVETDAGAYPAVTPAGRPDAVSAIVWAVPDRRVVVTLVVPALPSRIETPVGDAELGGVVRGRGDAGEHGRGHREGDARPRNSGPGGAVGGRVCRERAAGATHLQIGRHDPGSHNL